MVAIPLSQTLSQHRGRICWQRPFAGQWCCHHSTCGVSRLPCYSQFTVMTLQSTLSVLGGTPTLLEILCVCTESSWAALGVAVVSSESINTPIDVECRLRLLSLLNSLMHDTCTLAFSVVSTAMFVLALFHKRLAVVLSPLHHGTSSTGFCCVLLSIGNATMIVEHYMPVGCFLSCTKSNVY